MLSAKRARMPAEVPAVHKPWDPVLCNRIPTELWELIAHFFVVSPAGWSQSWAMITMRGKLPTRSRCHYWHNLEVVCRVSTSWRRIASVCAPLLCATVGNGGVFTRALAGYVTSVAPRVVLTVSALDPSLRVVGLAPSSTNCRHTPLALIMTCGKYNREIHMQDCCLRAVQLVNSAVEHCKMFSRKSIAVKTGFLVDDHLICDALERRLNLDL
jgi:hypothetical protein